MKKSLLTKIGLVFLYISTVFANTSSTQYSSSIHQGLKLSLDASTTKLAFNYKFDVSAGDFSPKSYNEEFDTDAKTLAIGYQKVAPSKWGYSVFLERTQMKNKNFGADFNLDMVEGNATYGLGEKWFMAFGGNLSKYSTNDQSFINDMGVGIGTQFAFAYQPQPYMSVEIQAMLTSHSAQFETYGDQSGELSIISSALRLGLAATF